MNLRDLAFVDNPSFAIFSGGKEYDVRDFGAKCDGIAFDNAAIQRAIDTAASEGGGKVIIPAGTCLIKPIRLASNVELHLEKGARLLGSPDLDDYPNVPLKHIAFPDGLPRKRSAALICADEVRNVAITGEGTIDANGLTFVKEKDDPDWSGWKYIRKAPYEKSLPRICFITGCENVLVRGVSVTNGPAGWSWWFHDCDNVLIEDSKVLVDVRFPNNDGFHVNSSRNVMIRNCDVESGDDSIIVRANNSSLAENKICENVIVENCRLRSYANGIRIAWTQDGTIRNCIFRNIAIKNSVNGIAMQIPPVSPSNPLDHGREATRIEDILFENIEIDGAYGRPVRIEIDSEDPILLPVGGFKNVVLRNITSRGLERPIIRGRPANIISGISFENCRFDIVSDDELPDWRHQGAAAWERRPGLNGRWNSLEPTTFGNWKMKAIDFAAPMPDEVDRFCHFITGYLAPAGIQMLTLRIQYRYQFKSHPECTEPDALSFEDIQTIKAACDSANIKLVPKMNALGHQGSEKAPSALLRAHPDMDESRGKEETIRHYCRSICPTHPDSLHLVQDLTAELAEVFGANLIHLGCDEVFEIGTCERCKPIPTAKLFADWVNGLSRHLKSKGVTSMIWADRLLDAATTPYGPWEASDNGTHEALALLDKDIILCDWHYEKRESDPSAGIFAKAGFNFFSCPWRYNDNAVRFLKATLEEEDGHCQGLLFTTWYPAKVVMDAFEGSYAAEPGKDPKDAAAETLCSLARNFQNLFQDSPGEWCWYDGSELPLEGQGWSSRGRAWDRLNIPQKATYDRLPQKFEGKTSDEVWMLQTNTAGESFRFLTDSNELRIRWRPRSANLGMWHFPSTGMSGIDVYQWSDEHSCWRFTTPPWPAPPKAEGAEYTWKIEPGVPTIINLPLYNGIDYFRLGVKRGCTISELPPRKSGVRRPVVFYGTSTTQGGCVSRPGLCWTSIASRHADVPQVNLGFSGAGKMEDVMVDVLSEIDASCYCLDTTGNMHLTLLEERYEKFTRALNASKPLTPIVLCVAYPWDEGAGRNDRSDFVRSLYGKLKSEDPEKWARLYLFDDPEVVRPDNENTVEGAHLNDAGALRLGESFARFLRTLPLS